MSGWLLSMCNGVDIGRKSTGKPTPGPTAAEAPKADLKEAARNILMEADQAAKDSPVQPSVFLSHSKYQIYTGI